MNATDASTLPIVSSMPKAWETESSFNDLLYDWMGRAPWLALSAAAHLLMLFILWAIPWEQLSKKEEKSIVSSISPVPVEDFEQPPPEQPEPIEELEPTEEPVLKDAEISDHNEEDTDAETHSAEGDPQFSIDPPFDSHAFINVMGLGSAPGGKFGQRFGGSKDRRAGGGRSFEPQIQAGLKWLHDHQSEGGQWETDSFTDNCGKNGRTGTCSGSVTYDHDVGVTGLALLAFMGDGHTTREGPFKQTVARGINYLKEVQLDPSVEGYHGGRFGMFNSKEAIYDHAIATLAMCEAYYFSNRNPMLKRSAQSAVDYIVKARNPYGAWRYDVPPIGDNDTSITGWMIFALKAAEEAQLTIDRSAYADALRFLDEMTDPTTGRTGYTIESVGQGSSRSSLNEEYRREKSEALTAVSLLCRFFMGQDPSTPEGAIMKKQAKLLKDLPPKWEDPRVSNTKSNDMYYWYYGAYAMFQYGGEEWATWRKAMEEAVAKTQSQEGCEKGSWDPECAWGFAGGRVYSTATMVLCLETYYRYGRVLGSR